MAVYYKFQSEKDYKSICVHESFITLSDLKDRIFLSRYVNRGTDLDIQIINAHTNQEYNDEAMLIPKCTTILVRRTPKHVRSRLIADLNKLEFDSFNEVSSEIDAESIKVEDEFGPEVYAPLPQQTPAQASNAIQSNPTSTTPASYLQSKADKGFGPGRGGRTTIRGSGLTGIGWNKPPHGYVCHRCNEPGHFIQHCPTNRILDYDVRLYSSRNGNKSPIKNEVGSSRMATYSQGEIPPELSCLLCKQVMKDAVLARKCCFNSYCNICIRDYISSKSICVCGAKDILADDLIPNMTLRDTITRILVSSSSSSNGCHKSTFKLQDKELASKDADKEESQKKNIAHLSNKRKNECCQSPGMNNHVEYKRTQSFYGASSISSQVKNCRQLRMVEA